MQLPANTCSYDRYDTQTLQPINVETSIRLAELGWTEDDFRGRSVLDIGMNAGLLSVFACKLGAASVHSTDVSAEAVTFFADVAAQHKLPIRVELRAFDKLEDKDAADIVLFMEVIHWSTSQGMPIPDAIARLARLTKETLYIEFPWSVDEPSIKAQTTLTAEAYSADMILDHLTRQFEDVRIVSFMNYFGYASPSRRALVRASRPRDIGPALIELGNASLLPCNFTRGRNGIAIVNSPNGPKVVKAVERTSALGQMPQDSFDALMQALSGSKTIVPPLRIGTNYAINGRGGARLIVMPLIQEAPHALTPTFRFLSGAQAIDTAIAVRRDLRAADNMAPDLAKLGFSKVTTALLADLTKIVSAHMTGTDQRLVLDAAKSNKPQLNRLCHFDLQSANVVRDRNFNPRVVDLDNLGLGTAYADGLLAAAWNSAKIEDIDRLEHELAQEEGRRIEPQDVIVAIAYALSWKNARERLGSPLDDWMEAAFAAGIKVLITKLRSISSRS